MYHEKRGPRIEEEAAVLAEAAHPGVVELVGVDAGVLRTQHVNGRPLSDVGPLPPEEIAGIAAGVAATLADLHDLGVVHGGLDATHVIVADDGRPVLCSLGRSGRPVDDVAALGRMVSSLVGGTARDPLRARLQLRHPRHRRRLGPMLSNLANQALATLAAEATVDNPERRPGARELAAAFRDRIPGARLPPAENRTDEDTTDDEADEEAGANRAGDTEAPSALTRPSVRVSLATAAAVAILGLGGWWSMARSGPPRTTVEGDPPPAGSSAGSAEQRPSTHPVTPPAARVWPPEPLHYDQGILTFRGARYRIGQPGDVLTAGDWACTGEPSVVLLRPATGQVFAFDQWAGEAAEVTARPVGEVPGATALRPVDTDGDGCHELEVTRPQAPPANLDVAR